MSSELNGSGGDQPTRRADQPGERDDPFRRVPRDVNYMPASAGWKPDSGISRADYYRQDGEEPGQRQAADAARHGTGTGTPDAVAIGTSGPDSGTDDGTDDTQMEETGPVSGGLDVEEAPVEVGGAGGGPPLDGPDDGPDTRGSDPGLTPDRVTWEPHKDESVDDPGTVSGRDGAIDAGPSAGIREAGEEDERGDSGTGRKTRPEASEQPRQGDAAAPGEMSTRTDGDADERESSDRSAEQDGNAEQTRERAQPMQETREEPAPEASADQRMDAFEQRMQSMMEQKLQEALESAKAEMKADYEAKLEEQKTEQEAAYEARIESIKADYDAKLADQDAKLDELAAKADGGQPDGDTSPDRKLESEEDPDVSGAEQRGDRIQRGVRAPEDAPDDLDVVRGQEASLDQQKEIRQKTDVKQAEQSRWRRAITSENVGAAGTVAGAVNTVAMAAGHLTPEGVVSMGITVVGVAALGMAKREKHRKDKE